MSSRSVLWAVAVFSLVVACDGDEITSKDDRKEDRGQFRVMQREMENLKSELQLMRAQLKSCSSDREVIRKVENDHVILHWVQTALHDLRSEVSEMERTIGKVEEKMEKTETENTNHEGKINDELQELKRILKVIW